MPQAGQLSVPPIAGFPGTSTPAQPPTQSAQTDDFQYVKLPDGSYGKFSGSATDDQIKAAINRDFPQAFSQSSQSLYDKARADFDAAHGGPTTFLQRLTNSAKNKQAYNAASAAQPMPGMTEGAPLAQALSDWVDKGPIDVGRGTANIAQGNIAKGGHQLISGAGQTAMPAMPFIAMGNPAMVARGLAGGAVGGMVGQAGASAAGANPDQTAFAGDIGNLIGGFAAASGLPRALLQTPLKRFVAAHNDTLLNILQPRQALINMILKLSGGVAEKAPAEAVPAAASAEIQPTRNSVATTEAAAPTTQPAPATSARNSTVWPPETPSALQPRRGMTPAQLSDILETRAMQESMRQNLEQHGQAALSQEMKTFFANNKPGAPKGDLVAQARANATTVVQPKPTKVIQTPQDLIEALKQMAIEKGKK